MRSDFEQDFHENTGPFDSKCSLVLLPLLSLILTQVSSGTEQIPILSAFICHPIRFPYISHHLNHMWL